MGRGEGRGKGIRGRRGKEGLWPLLCYVLCVCVCVCVCVFVCVCFV